MDASLSRKASQIRQRLSFDVERLKASAHRLDGLEAGLTRLKDSLERRATRLSGQATSPSQPEMAEDGQVSIRYAQAQATAQLAMRAKMGEVLAKSKSGRLAMIAAMATNRWINAITRASSIPMHEAVVKGHIDAGRLAHRMLVTLRSKAQLRSGCGQLVSAVVAAELVHPDNQAFVAEQIEEGLHRSLNARHVESEDDAIEAASRALRVGAQLLESMADKVEVALSALTAEADKVEATVEQCLQSAVSGRADDPLVS